MALDAALQARARVAHAAVHGLVALVLEQLGVQAPHHLRIVDAGAAARLLDHRPGSERRAAGHGQHDDNDDGEALDKRPKIDVHGFDLTRKMVEKGLKITRIAEPTWGTDASTGAIHNYDNRSDRYVIPHNELFLGHFGYTPRLRREIVNLTAAEALNNFEERMKPLLEAQAQAEAKRCMSCGLCFECDNCVVYCPQTAVFKVKKTQATTGRYVDTDYTKCIGCHICKDVCPTGYIQMGLGE